MALDSLPEIYGITGSFISCFLIMRFGTRACQISPGLIFVHFYQTDAVNSVVKVFAGQPFQNKLSYRRDTGDDKKYGLAKCMPDIDALSMGFANAPITLDQHLLDIMDAS